MGKLRKFAEKWGYLDHNDIQKRLLEFEDPESVLKQQLDSLTDFESIRLLCVSDKNISDNNKGKNVQIAATYDITSPTTTSHYMSS